MSCFMIFQSNFLFYNFFDTGICPSVFVFPLMLINVGYKCGRIHWSVGHTLKQQHFSTIKVKRVLQIFVIFLIKCPKLSVIKMTFVKKKNDFSVLENFFMFVCNISFCFYFCDNFLLYYFHFINKDLSSTFLKMIDLILDI